MYKGPSHRECLRCREEGKWYEVFKKEPRANFLTVNAARPWGVLPREAEESYVSEGLENMIDSHLTEQQHLLDFYSIETAPY